MLEYGADPNLWDLYKNTPLHLACKFGNVEIIDEFLKSDKIDLKAKDSKGKLPYQILMSIDQKKAQLLMPDSNDI